MATPIAESKPSTGTVPSALDLAHSVDITSAASHGPGLALGFWFTVRGHCEIELPWILFDFDEFATSSV